MARIIRFSIHNDANEIFTDACACFIPVWKRTIFEFSSLFNMNINNFRVDGKPDNDFNSRENNLMRSSLGR